MSTWNTAGKLPAWELSFEPVDLCRQVWRLPLLNINSNGVKRRICARIVLGVRRDPFSGPEIFSQYLRALKNCSKFRKFSQRGKVKLASENEPAESGSLNRFYNPLSVLFEIIKFSIFCSLSASPNLIFLHTRVMGREVVSYMSRRFNLSHERFFAPHNTAARACNSSTRVIKFECYNRI